MMEIRLRKSADVEAEQRAAQQASMKKAEKDRREMQSHDRNLTPRQRADIALGGTGESAPDLREQMNDLFGNSKNNEVQ
jgi:hypothetical protein